MRSLSIPYFQDRRQHEETVDDSCVKQPMGRIVSDIFRQMTQQWIG
jgi:hypothetical protein